MKEFVIGLFLFFQTTAILAQSVWEISYWEPKNTVSNKLVKSGFYLEKYNEAGLLVEKEECLYGNTMTHKTTYEYNDKKQLVTETKYSPQDVKENKKEYVYDENGLLKKMMTIGRTKELTNLNITEDHFYDEQNNLVKKIRTSDGTGLMGSWIYEYKFDNGNKTVIEKDASHDKKQTRKVLIFNEKGLLIESRESYYRHYYEYTYDSNGEWETRKIYLRQSMLLRQKICWRIPAKENRIICNVSSKSSGTGSLYFPMPLPELRWVFTRQLFKCFVEVRKIIKAAFVTGFGYGFVLQQ